ERIDITQGETMVEDKEVLLPDALTGMASRLLERIPQDLEKEMRAEARNGRLRLGLIVAPVDAKKTPRQIRSERERAILAPPRELGSGPDRRFRRPDIIAALERRGTSYGLSTISQALARLARPEVALLVNNRDRAGYGLSTSQG